MLGCLGAVLKTCGNIMRGRMGIRNTYLDVGVTAGAFSGRPRHAVHEKPSRYDWGVLEAILGQSARLGLSSGSVRVLRRIFKEWQECRKAPPRAYIPIQKLPFSCSGEGVAHCCSLCEVGS